MLRGKFISNVVLKKKSFSFNCEQENRCFQVFMLLADLRKINVFPQSNANLSRNHSDERSSGEEASPC